VRTGRSGPDRPGRGRHRPRSRVRWRWTTRSTEARSSPAHPVQRTIRTSAMSLQAASGSRGPGQLQAIAVAV